MPSYMYNVIGPTRAMISKMNGKMSETRDPMEELIYLFLAHNNHYRCFYMNNSNKGTEVPRYDITL
jgi:hypothetical protein